MPHFLKHRWNFCKILSLLLLSLILVKQASAEETASNFADKVQSTYEATQSLRLEFQQKTYVELLEREVSKKGSAQFKKPGKFAIRYEGNRARQYLSNGKTLWVFEQGDSQVQETKLDDDSIPAEALSFLGGLGKLKRDFAVEEISETKQARLKLDKNKLRWLELTPLKKRSSIQSLVMGFDPKNYWAREVYLFTESGNLSHYEFLEVKAGEEMPDKQFEK